MILRKLSKIIPILTNISHNSKILTTPILITSKIYPIMITSYYSFARSWSH